MGKQHLHIVAPEANQETAKKLLLDIEALSEKYDITFEIRTEKNSLAPHMPQESVFDRYKH